MGQGLTDSSQLTKLMVTAVSELIDMGEKRSSTYDKFLSKINSPKVSDRVKKR